MRLNPGVMLIFALIQFSSSSAAALTYDDALTRAVRDRDPGVCLEIDTPRRRGGKGSSVSALRSLCQATYAVQADDVEFCRSLRAGVRDGCLNAFAARRLASGTVSYEDALARAVRDRDPGACMKIDVQRRSRDAVTPVPILQSECQVSYAIETDDIEFCRTLSSGDRGSPPRDQCLKALAGKLARPDLCDEAFTDRAKHWVLRYGGECRVDAARTEADCRALSRSSEWYGRVCFGKLAKGLKRPDLCRLAHSGAEDVAFCEASAAGKPEQACEARKSLEKRATCYYFLALETGDPKLCDKGYDQAYRKRNPSMKSRLRECKKDVERARTRNRGKGRR